MNLQQIIRAAMSAALVTVCLASAILLPAQSVSGQEIQSTALGPTARSQQIYRPGLRNSFIGHPLSSTELNLVPTQLRHKTGFLQLRFDEAGFLTIDDRSQISGGSEAARELLLAAIDGTKSIILQSHNRSPQVVFARVTQGAKFTSWQSKLTIESDQIEIDFVDFKQLRGHQKAIEAFDPGYVILHELCHTVLGLHDPSGEASPAGECETYVNRIRRELGMPERQQYATTSSMKHISLSTPTTKVARLSFAQVQPGNESGKRAKTKTFFISWNAREVGNPEVSAYRQQ